MLRTCVVRFAASVLTLSVRSFQTPLTPFTFAWPPSLPSVPTSRATRVTSSANDESWSTIAFTVVPMRRNSPFTGCPSIVSCIFCERSPSATASMTRATSVVGRTRSSISVLSAFVVSAQWPTSAGACGALGQAALAADGAADAGDFLAERLAPVGELVEGAVQVGGDALAARRAGGAWKLPSRAAWSAASSSLELALRDLARRRRRRSSLPSRRFAPACARLRGRLPPPARSRVRQPQVAPWFA